MIEKLEFELLIKTNDTKLEKVTLLQQCSHNVCIISN